MNTVLLIPVYNEEENISEVLESLPDQMTIILVDDGSIDGSAEILDHWCQGRANSFLIRFQRNRGKSKAMIAGFAFTLYLLSHGDLNSHDLLIAMDGDGQHQADYIEKLITYNQQHDFGMVIGCRDFSNYPAIKVLGNRLMSLSASLIGGFPFKDVECGLRSIRLDSLKVMMPFLSGQNYSLEQETAVLAARCNCTISNDFLITVPIFKSNTKLWDVVINLTFSLAAALRFFLKINSSNQDLLSLPFEKLLSSGSITYSP